MRRTGDSKILWEWHGNCFYKLVSSIKTTAIHAAGITWGHYDEKNIDS
jgi:hypothetical protein